MKKIGIVAVLGVFAAGLWAAGCGGSGGSDVSCDITAGTFHYCAFYSNLTSDQETAAKSACAGGTVGTSCPSANALGTCTVSNGGISASETYYAATGVTADSAQQACTVGGGTWTKA